MGEIVKKLARCFLPDGTFITVPFSSNDTIAKLKADVIEKAKKKGIDLDAPEKYTIQITGSNNFLHVPDKTVKCFGIFVSNPVELSLVPISVYIERKLAVLNERVFFSFGINKIQPHSGNLQPRLLHFDFQAKVLSNLEKETVHRSFAFDQLINFNKSEENSLGFTIGSSCTAPYECEAQTEEDREMICELMKNILKKDYDGVKDMFPSAILKSGHVEKKEKKQLYSKRYLILVPGKLYSFKDSVGVFYPRNVIALNDSNISLSDNEITVKAARDYTFTFKLQSKEELQQWASAFLESVNFAFERPEREESTATRKRANTREIARSVLNIKVFFNFAVLESQAKAGEEYIVHFDLQKKLLSFVQKEKIKKQYSFADLDAFGPNEEEGSLSFFIEIKGGERMDLFAQTPEEREILCALLARVYQENFRGLDANEPRQLIKSGYVEKRDKKGTWTKRYMMLVPWKLYVFKSARGVSFPRNVVSLYNARLSEFEDANVIEVGNYRFIFRASTAETTKAWAKSITMAAKFSPEMLKKKKEGEAEDEVDRTEREEQEAKSTEATSAEAEPEVANVETENESSEAPPGVAATSEEESERPVEKAEEAAPAEGEEEVEETPAPAIAEEAKETPQEIAETETEEQVTRSAPESVQPACEPPEEVAATTDKNNETEMEATVDEAEQKNVTEGEAAVDEGEQKIETEAEAAVDEGERKIETEAEAAVDEGEQKTETQTVSAGATLSSNEGEAVVLQSNTEGLSELKLGEEEESADEEDDERGTAEGDDEDLVGDLAQHESVSLVETGPTEEVIKSDYVSPINFWQSNFSETVSSTRNFWKEMEKSK